MRWEGQAQDLKNKDKEQGQSVKGQAGEHGFGDEQSH
jgi:hypothetical protein